MHRFRKKSDVSRRFKAATVEDTDNLEHSAAERALQNLPLLPLDSDFRTSLILPDLSRRFSLLRSATGNPVSVNELRTRLANQRASRSENLITEDEEEVLINAILSNMQRGVHRNVFGQTAEVYASNVNREPSWIENFTSPTYTRTTGTASTPVFQTSVDKRYSNDGLGGRLNSSPQSQLGRERYVNTADISKSANLAIGGFYEPITPADTPVLDVNPRGKDRQLSQNWPGQQSPPERPPSAAEYRSLRNLSPAAFRRASLALEQVIMEIEEEAASQLPQSNPIDSNKIVENQTDDDEVVMPRSPRSGLRESAPIFSQAADVPDLHPPMWSPGRRSPGLVKSVDSQRLPGYIPGMPRPMTPLSATPDIEDESRPISVTPRPKSPHIVTNNSRSPPPLGSPGFVASRGTGPAIRNSTLSQSQSFSSMTTDQPQSSIGTNSWQESSDADSSRNSLSRRRSPSPLVGGRRPPSPLNNSFSSRNGTMYRPTSPLSAALRARAEISDSYQENPLDSRSETLKRSDSQRRANTDARSGYLPRADILDSPSFGYDVAQRSREQSDLTREFLAGETKRSVYSPTPTQAAFSSNATNGAASSSIDMAPRVKAPSRIPIALDLHDRPESERLSTASDRSSYHSELNTSHTFSLDIFENGSAPSRPWHDFTSSSQATTIDGEPEDEAVVRQTSGLTKANFAAIQGKLMLVAIAKASSPERPVSLRRRRPSTAQSTHSITAFGAFGADSPSLISISGTGSRPVVTERNAEILSQEIETSLKNHPESVHKSLIGTQPAFQDFVWNQDGVSEGEERHRRSKQIQQRDLSPTSRRNRDLAQALFGAIDHASEVANVEEFDASQSNAVMREPYDSYETVIPRLSQLNTPNPIQETTQSPSLVDVDQAISREFSLSSTLQDDNTLLSTSMNPIHQSASQSRPLVNMDIAREVQRKAHEATVALKRGNSAANASSASLTRRRVNIDQISGPNLLSASNTLDGVPVRSHSVTGGSLPKSARLGQKLRRWGTLRSKPTFSGGDETPEASLAISPLSIGRSASTASRTVPISANGSLTELSLSRSSVNSASSSKGFLSLFRKPREEPPKSLISSPWAQAPSRITLRDAAEESHSAPASIDKFNSSRFRHDLLDQGLHSAPSDGWIGKPNVAAHDTHAAPGESSSNYPIAHTSDHLHQLFEAANNLGIDQNALGALLARSTSSNSRSTEWNKLTRNKSTGTGSRPPTREDHVHDNSRLYTQNPDHDANVRYSNSRGFQSAIMEEDIPESNEVVRRTIIYPEDPRQSATDLASLHMRKASQVSRKQRSNSAASRTSSGRSVIDRTPTPPPQRGSLSRRLNEGSSHPVPNPPMAIARGANHLQIPSGPISDNQETYSPYDSVYDMYGDDRSINGWEPGPRNTLQTSENPTQPGGERVGVEVMEMANGESIWSIIRGLRDGESTDRSQVASLSSDLSRENGVQVFFKGHTKAKMSQSSTQSFRLRKTLPAGDDRPETKVFYSSPNQIGRLITDLSESQESGSFNFQKTARQAHSASSSLQFTSIPSNRDDWTVEQRLDNLLGSMGGASP